MEELVASETGRELFLQFLKAQNADENLRFWIAVKEFKKLEGMGEERLKSDAAAIWEEFFSSPHTQHISTSSEMKSAIEAALDHPTLQIFDVQLKYSKNLLRVDMFLGFFNSRQFADFLRTLCEFEMKEWL